MFENVSTIEWQDGDQVEESPPKIDVEQIDDGESGEVGQTHHGIARNFRGAEDDAREQEARERTGKTDDHLIEATEWQQGAPRRSPTHEMQGDLGLDAMTSNRKRVTVFVDQNAHEHDEGPDDEGEKSCGALRRVHKSPAKKDGADPKAGFDLDFDSEQREIHALDYPNARRPLMAGSLRCQRRLSCSAPFLDFRC